jgi:competence ComEA-like helix-hairpin-helix protein
MRHYIDRGGRFREPSELKKVYGLFDDEFERLRPFVKIENYPLRTVGRQGKLPESTRNPSEEFENRAPLAGRTILKPGVSYNVSNRKNPHIIDINMADTNELKSLPGIGSRLSQRIINFREKLGGFYSVEQVGETFGLADSVFQKIKPYLVLNNREVKKINLNTATPEQLKAHPYIRYAVAGAIITYRNEHGLFKSTGDLKNIMAISHDIFQKIVPYLDVE